MSDTNNDQPRTDQRPAKEFTALSYLWRLLFALALVLLTYNPSGWSAFHWIRDGFSNGGLGPVHLLVGVLLLIGWAILWVATWRALDTFGVILVALALGALVWLLADVGILAAGSTTAIAWISLICLAGLLSIGLSWAHIWRRLTGQFNVDDVED
jgi:hypothetical protein